MATTPTPLPNYKPSYVPHFMRTDGPYGDYIEVAILVCVYVKDFILHNLNWLKELSGVKTLLIKIPGAIVLISHRIGPATHILGKMINRAAKFLMPLHQLGEGASALIGFAEAGYKITAMFTPVKNEVTYLTEAGGKTYRAFFSLNSSEQKANEICGIASWILSCTGCAGYLWRTNHPPDDKFPLAEIATWVGRYISLQGLYSEGRFLYETLWIGPQFVAPTQETQAQPALVKLATVELVGSLLRLSLAIVCLSVDIFKALAEKEQSTWVETALFCASVAPTFITPLATRYWPKMVVEPLYNNTLQVATPIK